MFKSKKLLIGAGALISGALLAIALLPGKPPAPKTHSPAAPHTAVVSQNGSNSPKLAAPSPTVPGNNKPVSTEPKTAGTVIRTSDPDKIIQLSQNSGLQVTGTQSLPDGEALVTLSTAASDPKVKDVVSAVTGSTVGPNVIYHALTVPNDPLYPQWYSTNIHLPEAWSITTGSSSVKVGVLDTGFALNHEDLVNQWDLADGHDYVNNDSDPSTTVEAHGTEVAGLIGAQANNSKGVAGVDWHATLVPLQVLDDTGSGTTASIVAALAHARSIGIPIVNLSLGAADSDATMQTEINNDISAGMTVVAAAGNCGDPSTYTLNNCNTLGQLIYPAAYTGVIAVGSVDSTDTRSSFSSYGPNLQIMAPGEGTIRSPTIAGANTTTAYASSLAGTSFASPIVAGTAALIKSQFPAYSNTNILYVLTHNADKVAGMGNDTYTDHYGYGRVNALGSLTTAYAWQMVSQSSTQGFQLTPGKLANFTLVVKNSGNATWSNSVNPVRLATWNPSYRISKFCSDNTNWVVGCVRAANLQESSVAPGSTGTFVFTIQTPAQPGFYTERFNLVMEGVAWFPDPWMEFDVNVTDAYTWSMTGQSSDHGFVLNKGQLANFTLTTKNTSAYTWTNTGNPVRLATWNPSYRISKFCSDNTNWVVGCVRAATLQESSVPPGGTGTFVFTVQAPNTAGFYTERFNLVMEGVAWMVDPWMEFDIVVQ